MERPIQIYVDSVDGNDHPDNLGHDGPESLGDQRHPVMTVEKAFSLLPDHWTGTAEIIFVPRRDAYTIDTDAIYLGAPVGSEASSLVIRADGELYSRVREITATGGDAHGINFQGPIEADSLLGFVISRLNSRGEATGPAISIRGNTGASGPTDARIELQRDLAVRPTAGERFAVEGPRVTLKPTKTLNLTSHDARSPNLTLIGIEIAPEPGVGLNFLNVRAFCDTCAFKFESLPAPAKGVIFNIHSDSRIQGGNENDPARVQAGVFIHSNNPANIVRAVRGGVLGGHLTFDKVTIQVSQGGWFLPRTLEAHIASIQILTGGSAMAEPNREFDVDYSGWGTSENKARIRNSNGDGIRIFNGGSVNSPLGPINLDIFGSAGDGVRLDSGGWGFFGPSATGLTSSANNMGFGMNVWNASRAVVGTDTRLLGGIGQLALEGLTRDDAIPAGWAVFETRNWVSNDGLSLVRLNKPRRPLPLP